MIRKAIRIAWRPFVLPAIFLWLWSVVHADSNPQHIVSIADVSEILVSMDRQITQVDHLIENMRGQVEEQYMRANTDPANRLRLEALAEEMAEKLMHMEAVRDQLVDERTRTGELLNEIQTR